jgi:HlyD family secretion protein
MPRPPQSKTQQTSAATMGTAQVWVLRDSQPVAVPVIVGASNGRQTEISGGELKTGMAVITDYQETQK